LVIYPAVAGKETNQRAELFQETLKTYAEVEPRVANQELLGHADARTTTIYTHCVSSRTLKEAKSLLDF
jgi:integrase